jgi:hypothetical protein
VLLLLYVQNTNSLCPAAPYSTVCYTPKGLAWYSEWGTLRNTGEAADTKAACGQLQTTWAKAAAPADSLLTQTSLQQLSSAGKENIQTSNLRPTAPYCRVCLLLCVTPHRQCHVSGSPDGEVCGHSSCQAAACMLGSQVSMPVCFCCCLLS